MGARITGAFKQLRRLRANLADLASPTGKAQRDVAREVEREVRQLIREQFRTGEGPDGPHQPRADGRPGLMSRRLPSDYNFRIQPAGLWVQPSRARWLGVHQTGHTFPPRAGGGQVLTYNKSGKLLRGSRIAKQKFVFERTARAHTIGQRVLPARPIYPTNIATSPRWSSRIVLGQRRAMLRWGARATK